MDLFGNKKRAAGQVKIEFALAALSAHVGCLHAFILALLGTRPPPERETLLDVMGRVVVRLGELAPPFETEAGQIR